MVVKRCNNACFDAIFTYCGLIGIQSPSLLLAILNICIEVPPDIIFNPA